jgi:carbon monoxide dehydrogenase subunit G
MAVVNKSLEIHAPVATIFAIVDDEQRLAEYVPGVTRVEDVQRTDRHIGDSIRVVYSLLGRPMPQRFVTTAWSRNEQIAMNMEGSMPGTFVWTFQAHGDSTRVSIHIDYQLPGGPLGKAFDAILMERMNDKNIERTLENLQLICEAPRG